MPCWDTVPFVGTKLDYSEVDHLYFWKLKVGCRAERGWSAALEAATWPSYLRRVEAGWHQESIPSYLLDCKDWFGVRNPSPSAEGQHLSMTVAPLFEKTSVNVGRSKSPIQDTSKAQFHDVLVASCCQKRQKWGK